MGIWGEKNPTYRGDFTLFDPWIRGPILQELWSDLRKLRALVEASRRNGSNVNEKIPYSPGN